jgi:hypothetical protein
VSEFRRLGDGSVSFEHPEVALGTFGPSDSRRKIDATTFDKTFNPRARSRDLEGAVNGQYTGHESANLSQTIADWIRKTVRSGWDYGTSSQGKALGTMGVLGGIAGAGYGAFKALDDPEASIPKTGLLYGLLAGGVAAGGTALGQYLHNSRERQLTKQASVADDIAMAVSADPAISYTQREAIIRGLSQLGNSELTELGNLLRMGIGASVGSLVMRYLKGKGLLPTIVGGIVGAIAGRATAAGPIYNAMGQLSTLNLR